MKTLILIIITLLLAIPCLAGSGSVAITLSGTAGAAGGCSESTNEVGNRNQETNVGGINPGEAFASRAQADCTGTLGTAYVYHGDTVASEVKICVYNDAGTASALDTSDTLVGCTAAMSIDTSTGWKTGAINAGSVTSGNYYWVIILTNSALGTFAPVYSSSPSLSWWHIDWTSNFATPPANTGAGWADIGTYAPISAYVTIK
jgi:hypothetical protein